MTLTPTKGNPVLTASLRTPFMTAMGTIRESWNGKSIFKPNPGCKFPFGLLFDPSDLQTTPEGLMVHKTHFPEPQRPEDTENIRVTDYGGPFGILQLTDAEANRGWDGQGWKAHPVYTLEWYRPHWTALPDMIDRLLARRWTDSYRMAVLVERRDGIIHEVYERQPPNTPAPCQCEPWE